MKIIYETEVEVTGGREGLAKSKDGRLEVKLGFPKELGGPAVSSTTNPEQLFGAGFAACFESAIRFVAKQQKVNITESKVTSKVSLSAKPEGGFLLGLDLIVDLPGLDPALKQKLVTDADQVCPYSNATRANLNKKIEILN